KGGRSQINDPGGVLPQTRLLHWGSQPTQISTAPCWCEGLIRCNPRLTQRRGDLLQTRPAGLVLCACRRRLPSPTASDHESATTRRAYASICAARRKSASSCSSD